MKKWIIILLIAIITLMSFEIFAQDFKVEIGRDKKIEKEDKDIKKSERNAQIVVTGTRSKKFLRSAPVKTDVIGKEQIESKGAVTLFEILTAESGLNADQSCLNCGSSDVGLNGMPGNYTQILFNGIPTLSSLAGTYFLQQYPSELIDRIEIVKGGGSALYGSGAVGGVINVITKKPTRNEGNLTYKQEVIDLSKTFAYTTSGFTSVVTPNGKGGIALYGSKMSRDPYDRNSDGVTEIARAETLTFGMNGFYTIIDNLNLNLNYSSVSEDRRGGDQLDKNPFYTNITEQIKSDRNSVDIRLNHEINDSLDYTVYFAYSLMNRHSYYGPKNPSPSNDSEIIENANMLGTSSSKYYNAGVHANFEYKNVHTISIGYDFNGDKLIDTNEALNKNENNYFMNHGLYLQYNLELKKFELIAGVRGDKHSEVGNIVLSPRTSAIINFTKDLHFRAAYSMGFKAPQTFDEDHHIAVSVESADGYIHIVKNDPDLKEERSHTVNSDFSGEIKKGRFDLDFSAGIFWTTISNRMEIVNPTLDGNIIIHTRENASGNSNTIGNNFELNIKYKKLIKFTNGLTYIYYSKMSKTQDWGSRNVKRQPSITGSTMLQLFYKNFTGNFNIQYIGSMEVPFDDDSQFRKTPFYPVLNLRLAYRFNMDNQRYINLFTGINNITNAFQKNSDITGITNRDPDLVYGPTKPLTIYAGIKIGV